MIPADIEDVKFTATRLKQGYDADEVDNFLDQVAAYVRGLTAANEVDRVEVKQLKRQLAETQRMLDEYGNQPTQQIPSFAIDATKILEAAQRTADDVISQANGEADRIRWDAKAEANDTVGKAESVVADMRAKLRELKRQCEGLREFLTTELSALKEKVETRDADAHS